MLFIPFLIAAVALAVTPGPGIAYVVARTVAGGRTEGLASCLGTGIGGLLHVLAAALGLALVIAESAIAFNVLKYIGVAYLVYLGIRILMLAGRSFTVDAVTTKWESRALLDGFTVEALNVNTSLFFLAFVP